MKYILQNLLCIVSVMWYNGTDCVESYTVRTFFDRGDFIYVR